MEQPFISRCTFWTFKFEEAVLQLWKRGNLTKTSQERHNTFAVLDVSNVFVEFADMFNSQNVKYSKHYDVQCLSIRVRLEVLVLYQKSSYEIIWNYFGRNYGLLRDYGQHYLSQAISMRGTSEWECDAFWNTNNSNFGNFCPGIP